MKIDLSTLQPSPSGISNDYINEFQKIKIFLHNFRNDKDINSSKCELLLKKYEERYEESRYENIRTLRNTKSIDSLDSIVNLMNNIISNYIEYNSLNDSQLKELENLLTIAIRIIRKEN